MLKLLAYNAVLFVAAALFTSGLSVQAVEEAGSTRSVDKTSQTVSERPNTMVTIGPPVPSFLKVQKHSASSSSTGQTVRFNKKERIIISSPTPIPSFTIQKVAGVDCAYIDTDRVAQRPNDTCYTKMREEPDVESSRGAVLEKGDKVHVLKEESKESSTWTYVEIISSQDEERIGEEGYIEEWLLTGEDVPLSAKEVVQPQKSESAIQQEDTTEKKVTAKDVVIVEGVKSSYMYTFRVAEDTKGPYTKMRKEPDVHSKRIGMVRNGDKVQITEIEGSWMYGEVISSKDKESIGTSGYIESWLLTDQGVPPEPTATPTPAEVNTQPAVNAQIMSGDARAIFDKVNGHRQSIGLSPLNEDAELCGYASERAPEINDEIFGGSYVHAGFRQRGLGSLGIVENQVGMGSVDANFNWWMNSGLHRGSIEGNFAGTCVACVGPSCIQLFR